MSLNPEARDERRRKRRAQLRRRRLVALAGVGVLLAGLAVAGFALSGTGKQHRSVRGTIPRPVKGTGRSLAPPPAGSGRRGATTRGRATTTRPAVTRRSTATTSLVSAPRPRIVQRPIPFGDTRRQEMAQYALRHYGINDWRLTNPHVIVEHYTVTTTFSSAYSTFAADVPDSELHQLPGTCAHFIIDSDGTIYQLVPLTTMCRHTVGLNYTAIGIEHVGMRASDILDNPKQLDASLGLTAWLMATYGIQLRNVIGHNESLTSPYHKELYAPWRCQTHGDWTRAEMDVYRADLAKVALRYHLQLGPSAQPVTPARSQRAWSG